VGERIQHSNVCWWHGDVQAEGAASDGQDEGEERAAACLSRHQFCCPAGDLRVWLEIKVQTRWCGALDAPHHLSEKPVKRSDS
jgi:hypothetical protein